MKRGGHKRLPWFLPYAVVIVVLAVVASLIATSRGVVNRVMDLNNSGVWVTNDAKALWGRANRSAGVLDAALVDPNRESGGVLVDVFQDGEAVLAWNMTQLRLFPVDTRDAVAAAGVPIGMGMVGAVAMGGGTIASVTSDKGEVRTTTYSATSVPEVAGLGADRPAVAVLRVVSGMESGVDVAVDAQGRVFAASASGEWAMVDESGQASYGSVGQSLRSVAVSLVGGVGVVADPASGEVFLTNGVHRQMTAGVVPQQSGSDTTRVIVADPSGLTAISISGETTPLYTTPGAASVPPGASVPVAEPVVMGSHVYGAWAGTPGRVVRLDGSNPQEDVFPQDGSSLVKPTFRVNRGSVVLNDMATGAVFDVDERWAMDNWEDVAPDATELTGDEAPDSEDSPQAKDDHLWVRPGRASILHVLDNDTNPGTGIVAITAVDGTDAGRVTISPDGQTLIADVSQTQNQDMTFSYTITNRAVNVEDADEESSADVTVSMRAPAENSTPYQPGVQGGDETLPDYTVPSGGTLSIAPAGWWRDADSDPVGVISASVGDRVFPVTAQGLIQYTAQVSPGQLTERLDYTVSDGYGQATPGVLYIRVQSSSELRSVPPVAMSDSVRGMAGQPVVFYPLDNDVPGCDPLDKQAHLVLATPVGARVGLQVSTDLLTGAVTVTAERAGAYFLDYVAGYGSGFSAGKIRVDIGLEDRLSAMPDTAVVRGTVPVVIDVLANDRDQLGSVLTVTSATPHDPDRVRVGIMQGRWLRIEVVSSVITSTPTIIDYAVTNGVTHVTSQVSVTQTPMPEVDHVSVVDDQARVRVGDVTTISVLDNDSSESGEPLVVNDNVDGMANAGQLRVEDPSAPIGQETHDVGRAFVDGDKVRYEAPTTGEGRRVRIEYQAGVASGSPMTGYVWVDVVPEPAPQTQATPAPVPSSAPANNTPTPESVEARVVIGDAIQIPVMIYGQDPDGDSVTVAGLRTPPKYGRVVTVGANWLTYESYPETGASGMDSFQFYVQDRFGAVGIGTVRIGLSLPGDVPPPLGVDDVVTAQPGVEVTVYPVANDVVAIGTGDTRIVTDESRVNVDQLLQTVVTSAPAAGEAAASIGYHLDAGGVTGTSAQIMVRSQEGYLNPPNVFDHAAENIHDGTASVDVLDDAWDVDGPDDQIHIISVGGAGSFDGSVVSVPILDRGQVIPFQVEDGTGAQAMAVVFVPSLSDGRPTLTSGGLIRMDRNGTQRVNLDDYIVSPRNQNVHLTMASQAWTAPSSYLDLTVTTDQTITLRARSDYVGPAALTVEVRDSPDSTDPAALTGVVTIPVQIGPATPVLWCPEEVQEIVQGGAPRSVDVAELCHAWMPTQTEIDALRFTGTWDHGGEGITISGRDQSPLPSDLLVIQALPESRPGTNSVLAVQVDGYDVSAALQVRVIAAPKPIMSVSNVTDVQQGTTVEVPVTVTSQMSGAVQNIVRVIQTSGAEATVSFDAHTIHVTPGPASHGVLIFDVVGSDIADNTRTDRQVTSSFSVTVYGVPDPPAPPQPGVQLRSHSAVVTFVPGAENGAPILGYEVTWEGGSQSCALNTTCEITGLTNGTPYRFRVRALNKAGESAWSDLGPQVVPNAIPGAVTGLTASAPDCGSLLLSWGETQGEGTAPTMFHLTWKGQTAPLTIDGSNTSYQPLGLDNNSPYTFTIVAENEAGMSQLPVTVTSQSSCKPVWPLNDLTIRPQDMGDTAQILLSWPKADPQGPDPVTYAVTRTGPGGTKTFAPTTELSLGDNGDSIAFDGQTYTYAVTAVNATGGTAHTSAEITGVFSAIGHPDSWASVGGADAVSVTAKGDDRQIIVHVEKFPKFRDSSGEVRVTIAGVQVATLKPGSDTATLNGYANGTDVSAVFTACNSQQCNGEQTSSLAGGPFGSLAAPVLTPRLGEGRQVCFTASGSGNGRGATLVVTGDNGVGEFRSSSSLSPSLDRCVDAPWDTEVTFTAYLKTDSTTPSRTDSGSVTKSIRSAIGTPDEWAPGAVTATPTVTDGLVRSGSVTLAASSFPASNGGALAVSYTSAAGAGTIPASGSTVVSGLANGTPYTFSVVASNGSSKNTPVTVTATPYGPLDPPKVDSEPGEDTQACVRLSTPETGTNGAPARLVLLVGAVVQWQSDLTTSAVDIVKCVDAGDYNSEVTFSARMAAGPDQARPDSTAVERVATSSVGTPGELTSANLRVTPTGRSGQATIELVGALPAHNGGPDDQLRVDLTGLPLGGKVSLTAGTPVVVTGFTDGTPTTLTAASCNHESCNKVTVPILVTTIGEMTDLRLVSIDPPPGTTRVSKQVCAEFAGEANGGEATLEIKNSIDLAQIDRAAGDRTVTKRSCVDAGGANVSVTFSAELRDTSGISPQRESIRLDNQIVVSAADAGSMGVTASGTPTVTYHGSTATVCMSYVFDPNGGEARGTVSVTDPSSDETWTTAPVTNFTVPDGAPVPKELCGNVPTNRTRTVHFTAVITDVSGYGRPDVSPDPRLVAATVTEVGDMTIAFTSSGAPGGSWSFDKRVCATITANGGGSGVVVTATALGVPRTESGSGAISFEHCVTASGPGQAVTFTAIITDVDHGRGEKKATPVVVTSPLDPPTMSVGMTYFSPVDLRDLVSTNKRVCATFAANVGDVPAVLTITALGRSSEPKTGTGIFSDEWCVTASSGSQDVVFTATLADPDPSRRSPVSGTGTVTSARDPSAMDVTYTSSRLPGGAVSTNKQVCATFTAVTGNASATLKIEALRQSTAPKTSSGTFTDELCVTASSAGESVVFTATLTDDGHGRTPATKTVSSPSVTSPADPTGCTYKITAPTWLTVYYTSLPANSYINYEYFDTTGESYNTTPATCFYRDDSDNPNDCKIFSGSGSTAEEFNSRRDLYRNTVRITVGSSNGASNIATCTAV